VGRTVFLPVLDPRDTKFFRIRAVVWELTDDRLPAGSVARGAVGLAELFLLAAVFRAGADRGPGLTGSQLVPAALGLFVVSFFASAASHSRRAGQLVAPADGKVSRRGVAS